MKNYYRVLTIATSDCSGGAGIQADLKTFAAHGCYGMSLIVALTAQNTVGVNATHALPTTFITQQWQSIINDIGVDAIKIGMLYDATIIRTVVECLQQVPNVPIIVDPVMRSTSGYRLITDDAAAVLVEQLFPLAELITPNIAEAEALSHITIEHQEHMGLAAKTLAELGAQAVLVKGGDLLTDKSDDVVYCQATQKEHWFRHARINTRNTHGTGCTLSSAIAANRAQGHDLLHSIALAKAFISQAIAKGSDYQLGKGYGPVHHFHRYWSSDEH